MLRLHAGEDAFAGFWESGADVDLQVCFFGDDVFGVAGVEGRDCNDSKI
jgi:hypothetical protein